MISDSNLVKIGAVFNYLLMVFNLIYGFWLTPFLIENLGTDEYGLYKIVISFGSMFLMLNFGISDTMQRYVALYHVKNNTQGINEIYSICLCFTCIINVCIVFIGFILYHAFQFVYKTQLTPEEIGKGRMILILLMINMMFVLIENVYSGLLSGYNFFAVVNLLKIISVFVRMFVIYIFIKKGAGSIGLILITLIISLFTVFVELTYSKFRFKIRIVKGQLNFKLIKELGRYTFFMFITAVSTQIFLNIDNIVLGYSKGPNIVTLYSSGMFFFSMFQQISCGISGVMLPTVVKIDSNNNDKKELTKIIVTCGRIQFILLGAALAGIICTGKEFIFLWLGEGFENVYSIVLILLIPTMFELCTNVCVSILAARNKIKFRTIINFLLAIMNAVLTVIFVNLWSYFGAAIATAITYLICNLLIMNIYYSKVLEIDMIKIYYKIVQRIGTCLLISLGGILILNFYYYGTWMSFGLKVIVFSCLYGFLLYKYGLKKEELQQVPFIGKFIRKNT